MEFNNLVFPAPTFNFNQLNHYMNELIYIPSNTSKESSFIPCLFLTTGINKISKNFVIFFHGNAEDIFLSRTMAKSLLQSINMNIVIVEYPGYSIFKGEPSAEVILQNTTIVYDYIKNKFHLEDKNIFVFGRSIGTSPAIYLASVRNPSALFVVSSFTSIRAVAGNLVGPLKYLLKERFISKDYILYVKCPVIFIHGKSDPLIPYTETLELKNIYKNYSEVIIHPHMTHNDFNLISDIVEPIGNFIKQKIEVEDEKIEFNKNDFKEWNKMPEEVDLYIKSKLK